MGVNLSDIVSRKTVELNHLNGRIIAVDAYNTLYQFLSIIRQVDGSPLMNSEGQITSHLSGLFYRTVKIIEAGVRPVFVFDGVPPEQKIETLKKRTLVRRKAQEKWDEALKRKDFEEAKVYAQQSTKLTKEMVEQSKTLLQCMGVPFVQAPAEGEAQASVICSNGDAWAVGSQDFDCLLFGAPKLLRNLTITGRRKLPRKNIYVDVKPELMELELVLNELGLTREQLVDLALLVGTDYNEGVKGYGPKKALQFVKKNDVTEFFDNTEELRSLFLKPNVTKDYSIKFSAPQENKIKEFLCEKNDFSEERIKNSLEKLVESFDLKGSQSRLGDWF